MPVRFWYMWRKEKSFNLVAGIVSLSILGLLIIFSEKELLESAAYSWVNDGLNEEDAFRTTAVSDESTAYMIQNEIRGEKLAEFITESYFYEKINHEKITEPDLMKNIETQKCIEIIKEKYKEEYETLLESNKAIWEDVKYFPVPESSGRKDAIVSYENSWKFERTFGGKRYHEGCDIMADINKRGVYPVISMCDGIVEKKGWLTKGGYRLGIRGENGGYFYYAHLESYADLEVGDEIKAGQFLGFMGDSGYGEEGTTGKFAVHLHVGIYIKTKNQEELSVNPYPVLKYLENYKLIMDFGKD